MPYRPNCALGEWTIAKAKSLETPFAEVTFDISHYEGKISVVEALRGKSGFLRLDRMAVKSLDNQEFLLFSAASDDGKLLDPNTAEKMFRLSQSVTNSDQDLLADMSELLEKNAVQYAKATATQVGEENNAHFKDATDKIIRWSEDQIAAATHRIETLRARQLEVEREIRHARTLDEQAPFQKEFDEIRRKIRKARANVISVEDETDRKRHDLLDSLQRRLAPEVNRETLFTIRWRVV